MPVFAALQGFPFSTLGGILLTLALGGETSLALRLSRRRNRLMKLQPLHDRIIVEAAAKEERTAGGIILPDTAQEKPAKGTVLAVGPGKTLDSGKKAPVDVKVGETVLYGKYSGTEVTVGGEDFVILRADDVLAVVEGEKASAKGGKKEKVGAR
jgi:chaperonin GroES